LTSQTFAGASKARKHYQAGEYKSALSEYQEMLAESPNDARLHYNAGAAAYHANKFDLALKEFQSAAATPDIDLQQQSFYNLANAEFRLGESNSNVQERIAIWEQAIQHYDAALKLRPEDKDAEFNRELVRKKLEELKKEQEQQKQNENKDNKEDKKENQDDQQKEDNQQEAKDENSKQDQKSNEQKEENKSPAQDEENQQKQQQKDQNQEQGKKDDKSNEAQPQQKGDKESEDQQKRESDGEAEAAQLGKMTPAQAKQLLDAQKGEEKALIFVPPERKSGAQNRTFKDW
jgi:Ca-activated chloride channel family protein